MRARTIEQYKILKWIEYNFVPGATATINCTEDGTVYLEETGCEENI